MGSKAEGSFLRNHFPLSLSRSGNLFLVSDLFRSIKVGRWSTTTCSVYGVNMCFISKMDVHVNNFSRTGSF